MLLLLRHLHLCLSAGAPNRACPPFPGVYSLGYMPLPAAQLPRYHPGHAAAAPLRPAQHHTRGMHPERQQEANGMLSTCCRHAGPEIRCCLLGDALMMPCIPLSTSWPGSTFSFFPTIHLDGQPEHWHIWNTQTIPASSSKINSLNINEQGCTYDIVNPKFVAEVAHLIQHDILLRVLKSPRIEHL